MNLLQEEMKKLSGINDSPIEGVMSWRSYVSFYMHLMKKAKLAKEIYLDKFAVMNGEVKKYDKLIERAENCYSMKMSAYKIIAKSMGKERINKQLAKDKAELIKLLRFIKENE